MIFVERHADAPVHATREAFVEHREEILLSVREFGDSLLTVESSKRAELAFREHLLRSYESIFKQLRYLATKCD